MCGACSLGERVSHYASLVVAENPIQAHREFVQEQRRRTSIIAVGVRSALGRHLPCSPKNSELYPVKSVDFCQLAGEKTARAVGFRPVDVEAGGQRYQAQVDESEGDIGAVHDASNSSLREEAYWEERRSHIVDRRAAPSCLLPEPLVPALPPCFVEQLGLVRHAQLLPRCVHLCSAGGRARRGR